MEKIRVKYRTWNSCHPPRQTKLQIPGWSGGDRAHENGAEPQPWHCPPFVEGSTYGHELVYPYKSECRVKKINGEIVFEGDFSEDFHDEKIPPMKSFARGHYGMSSALDMEPPEGYVLRTEPHPRFYTDETGTVPCLVTGHIQRWWSRIFFVVFKAPKEGETHFFREGEPYGQVLFVPQKNNVELVPFSPDEVIARESRERKISDYGHKIANRTWYDNKQVVFDDKYRVLSGAYAKCGYEGVDETIDSKAMEPPPPIRTKIPKRLFSLWRRRPR